MYYVPMTTNTNTALRLATAAGSLIIGGMSLVAPLSAFAYFGAMPSYIPATSVCNGDYDPNCFQKEANYLNASSYQYAPQRGYYGNSYVTPTNYSYYNTPASYTNYNNNSNYGYNNYSNYNSYSSYNSYNGYSSYNHYQAPVVYAQPVSYYSVPQNNYSYNYGYNYSYSY